MIKPCDTCVEGPNYADCKVIGCYISNRHLKYKQKDKQTMIKATIDKQQPTFEPFTLNLEIQNEQQLKSLYYAVEMWGNHDLQEIHLLLEEQLNIF